MTLASDRVEKRHAFGVSQERQRAPRWVAPAAGGLVGALLFLIARDALPDDSYITFGYARNLAERGEWALTPGIAANTATSPLNVWLLAALTLLLGTPVAAAAVLLAASCAATAGWLSSIARELGAPPLGTAMLGVALLVASPLLNSTVGLETYLATALLVAVTRYAFFGSWVATGVVTGLLVLARPDMVISAVTVLAVAALHRRQVARPAAALTLGALVSLPWSIYLWMRFGSATSDTLPAKSVAGGWGEWTMINGLGHYLERWTLPTTLALLPVALGAFGLIAVVVVVVRRRRLGVAGAVAIAFGLAGLFDYAALSAMSVVPFFWYYAPLVAGLSLCALTAAMAALRGRHRFGVAAVAAVTAVAGLSAGYDVLRGAPWDGMAPIRINWATPAEYREIGRALPRDAVVESPGEIGTIAYFCDCTVVDYLADPGRMTPYIERYRAEHIGSPLLAINYLWYQRREPVPAQDRLVYEFAPPGPDDFPTTFPGDVTKRMRLEPVPVSG